jgi:hypothetical protein
MPDGVHEPPKIGSKGEAGDGDGVRTMTTGEPKMTEMSKSAEILYRAFFDELRFAKQQQWTVTNYTLLLMGAAYGLAKLTAKDRRYGYRLGAISCDELSP